MVLLDTVEDIILIARMDMVVEADIVLMAAVVIVVDIALLLLIIHIAIQLLVMDQRIILTTEQEVGHPVTQELLHVAVLSLIT